MLHFEEKGGKSREIPVRHDLEQMIVQYIDAARLRDAGKDTPLFRTALRRTRQLTETGMNVVDVCRLMKRRLRDAGLPSVEAVESSLYMALEKAGYRPTRALQRLRAVLFTAEQASLLNAHERDAGLLVERRGFLPDGRAVEFSQSFYRGDTYDFVAELSFNQPNSEQS